MQSGAIPRNSCQSYSIYGKHWAILGNMGNPMQYLSILLHLRKSRSNPEQYGQSCEIRGKHMQSEAIPRIICQSLYAFLLYCNLSCRIHFKMLSLKPNGGQKSEVLHLKPSSDTTMKLRTNYFWSI